MHRRTRSAAAGLRGTAWRAAIVAAGLVLTACGAGMARPDLARLYARSLGASDQPPVIVIHGVLGAKLRDR